MLRGNIGCGTIDVNVWNVVYVTFGICTLLVHVLCSICGITWYMVFGIWYLVYGIWYMVYGIWYMVYGIWYMVMALVSHRYSLHAWW
jgi:hypothetical protein